MIYSQHKVLYLNIVLTQNGGDEVEEEEEEEEKEEAATGGACAHQVRIYEDVIRGSEEEHNAVRHFDTVWVKQFCLYTAKLTNVLNCK